MDVHKDTIALAVAMEGGGEPRYLGSFPNTPQAVRRQLKKLGPAEHLHCCYEAGPTGYSTWHLLNEWGLACTMVAPSLIPKKPGDRVKTDRRDARLLRSGDLTSVWVPTPAHEALRDPPSPSPRRCFDLGRQVARIMRESPWRVALMASSSWSHAFLVDQHHWLYPDHKSDRARLNDLRTGRFDQWRNLTLAQIESAGQQEFLNWVCLAGAMTELGYKAEILDWVETYVFNSNKAFALFHPA